jgi:DNA-binding SARP family transcriptional activator
VDPNDASGSGHYLGSQSPLPATLLSFTPAGAAAVTPTVSESGDVTGLPDDDGLFDALYSFVVPASLTTGTLTIGPGSFTGTEFTLYTAEDGNTTVDLAAPVTVRIGFPAVPVVANQKRPPWVGAALPPTAAPSASAGGSPLTTSPGHGFPIWLAVLVVVLLAAGVVVAQRLLTRRRLVTRAVSVVEPKTAPPTPVDDPVITSPAGEQVSSALVAPTSSPPPSDPAPLPMLRVLGPITYDAYRQTSVRRVIEELLCWLVLHNAHAHNADEIQLALRPIESSRPEVTRKTLHSYLSGLRQCIGADHLPDASGAAGYRITGIECDWFVFERLSEEADSATGPGSIALRQQALALVRGVPFQGVADGQYEWVFSEDLHIRMASAVIACALRLCSDLMALGRYKEAEAAASAGLLAAPGDEELRRMWNLAIATRNEGLTHPGRSIEGEPDEDEPDPEGPEEPDPPS